MLIDYDHRGNISEEERLASLKRSIQMALDEIYGAIGTSEGGQIVINKTMPASSIIDVVYPIGSVYTTTDSSFSPKEWPGSWALVNLQASPAEGEENSEPAMYQWKRTE